MTANRAENLIASEQAAPTANDPAGVAARTAEAAGAAAGEIPAGEEAVAFNDFTYNQRGHLLSPSGITTAEITDTDRFLGLGGLIGALIAVARLSALDSQDPILLGFMVSLTAMAIMFGPKMYRFYCVAEDVRAHGYATTADYKAAAAAHRSSNRLP